MNKKNELKDFELSDNDIDMVSGGCDDDDPVTVMVCSNSECGNQHTWGGNFVGQTFPCKKCGQNSFTGVRLG